LGVYKLLTPRVSYSSKDLSLLDLHDSNLESANRTGTTLELVFDWAKLAHLAEESIAEPVILGQTTLTLAGIREEGFKIYEDDAGAMRDMPLGDGASKLELIVANKLPAPTTLLITGLLNEDAGSNWAEWRVAFTDCTIFWHSFITRTEWLAGKLSKH